MTEEVTPTRRRLLRAGVVGVMVPIAGCNGVDSELTDTETPTDGTSTPTATLTPTPASTPRPSATSANDSSIPDVEVRTPVSVNTTNDSSIPDVGVQTPVSVNTSAYLNENLDAPDGDAGDRFGYSVALSDDGSTAAVGAPYDKDENGSFSGSVSLFEASDEGWRHRTKLTPSDNNEIAVFGWSVAVSSDGATVVIRSSVPASVDGQAYDRGVAHVFELQNGDYIERERLNGPDQRVNSLRGPVAVSSDGRTALLGNPPSPSGSGTEVAPPVSVLDARDGTWDASLGLKPQEERDWTVFGDSVALSGDGKTAIVGEPPGSFEEDRKFGTAHAFILRDGDWRHTRLEPNAGDAESGDIFGKAVAVSDDGKYAFVGAPGDPHPQSPAVGAVYLFERSDGSWRQADKFRTFDDQAENLEFGRLLSSDGSVVLIGAPDKSNSTEDTVGAAYVYEQSNSGWSEVAKLSPPPAQHTEFPASVAVGNSGATAILGEPLFNAGSVPDSGRAYVFTDFI